MPQDARKSNVSRKTWHYLTSRSADPGATGREDLPACEVVQNDAGHHVPGGERAGHELIAGDDHHGGEPEVAEVEKDETDEEEREGQRHGPMDTQGPDPEDHGEQRPSYEEEAGIGVAGPEDVKVVAQQHEAKRDPEGSVAGERAVPEGVARLHFLQASVQRPGERGPQTGGWSTGRCSRG